MNMLQATCLSPTRFQVVRNRLHNQFITTNFFKNPLSYCNRLYCCHSFPGEYHFQYRKFKHEPKKGLLLARPQDNVMFSSFFCPVPVRGMAGHSKWQNIRHIKGAKDLQKAQLSAKFSQRLRFAVKEGGKDPKFNAKLEKVIAEAKRADMTNAMIENVLKQSDIKMGNSSIVEIKLIGNCVLLVEVFTSKLQLTRNEIQAICKKHGAKIENGCGEGIFEHKGIIHIATTEEPNLDAALELAIEVGAEDVTVESDENSVPILKFICGPNDLQTVKKELETGNHDVTYSEYEYIPNLMYPLDANKIAIFEKLINKIYQHQDVVKIFDNVTLLE